MCRLKKFPRTPLHNNTRMLRQAVLGVDIGATTAKMGYVDHAGKYLSGIASVATGARQPADLFFKRLYESAEALRS